MQNIAHIVKSLVVAVLLAALVSQVAIANASAQETCEASFLGTTDKEVVEIVNSLEDECRYQLDSEGNLPEAPSGYQWAEDLTLVPNSYYSNSSGGESPSSSSSSKSKKATVTSDTVKEAPKASDSSAMKKAKALAAKAKSTAKSKPSKAKNTSEPKSPSKSSESSKSCKAEDGSTIENCKDYYSPAPKTSDDGWLVLVMDKGTTNKCSVFTSSADRAEADSIAKEYKASGKGAAVVHYTKSLAAKSPTC